MFQLVNHFGNDSRYSHSEAARRKQWFIKARQERQFHKDITEAAADNTATFGVSVIMATEAQIARFQLKLNAYDEASTAALLDNQIEFEQLQKRLQEIDAKLEDVWQHANIMDDGRRVFLNAERTQAYDEFGTEVSDEEYAYDQFPEGHFAIDTYVPTLKKRGEIHEAIKNNRLERDEIHAFEKKTGEARERVADGDLTKDELDEMDAELFEEMPLSVREHIPGFDTTDNAPAAKTVFTANANPAPTPQQTTSPNQQFGFDS